MQRQTTLQDHETLENGGTVRNEPARAPTNGNPQTICPPVVVSLAIYVSRHCPTCTYAYGVADAIRREFPQVDVRIVDWETTTETIPDIVFATPTYVLNGRVWSLGNPSPQQVTTTFDKLLNSYEQVGA